MERVVTDTDARIANVFLKAFCHGFLQSRLTPALQNATHALNATHFVRELLLKLKSGTATAMMEEILKALFGVR
jgi:hypothetical protein